MGWEELFEKLAETAAFWQGKNDRYNVPIVNDTRNLIKSTGKIADDFILGGTGQAALRGPDDLSKQILLNAALMSVSAGAGKGVGMAATKLAPKISPELAALRNYLSREQIMIRGQRGSGGEVFGSVSPFRAPSTYEMPSVATPEGFVHKIQSLYPQLGDTPVLWGFDPQAKDAAASALEYAMKHENNSILTGFETLADGATRPSASEVTKGAIGLVRVPSKSTFPEPVMPPWGEKGLGTNILHLNRPDFYRAGGLASTAPGKVVSSIDNISQFESTTQLEEALKMLLRQQGVGTKTQKFLAKIPKKK